MSGKLIVVESPTKAKMLKSFLRDATVEASKGHIRDLPKKETGIDLVTYRPDYVISSKSQDIIRDLKAKLKDADELILATDDDREGERIAYDLKEVLKPAIPTRRIVFHEITKKAIEEALKSENSRDVDLNLVEAQEARRVLDRLFGYTVSPALGRRLNISTLSAGRVQSPGLSLIINRELERINFRTSRYWDLKAGFAAKPNFEARISKLGKEPVVNGKDFFDPSTGELKNKKAVLLDEAAVNELKAKLETASWTVLSVDEKDKIQSPVPPFTTSTLQQEANRKLHLGTDETMKCAQRLYENGLITYMRTDSPALSEDATQVARKEVLRLYGETFVSSKPRHFKSKSKGAQEAHEGIRPAITEEGTFLHPDSLSSMKDKNGKEFSRRDIALYELIWKRTLACQMADAKRHMMSVEISAAASDGTQSQFHAAGSRLTFMGFIRVYYEGSDDPEASVEEKDTILPPLAAGDKLSLMSLDALSHDTVPPTRFTEAALVSELEKLGIGRPSTYASIIEKLLEKKYVIEVGRSLVPTFLGFAVMQFLSTDYFKGYIDYDYTSKMEKDLDLIAEGKLDRLAFLRDFYENPENGLSVKVKRAFANIKSGDAKRLNLPNISPEHTIRIGQYEPHAYVQTPEGTYISIPKDWVPGETTDKMVADLMANGKSKESSVVNIGKSPDGRNVYYNPSGKFGPYWQLGDRTDKSGVKFFSVPRGKSAIKADGKDYTLDEVLAYFALPRVLGKDSDGNEVVANKGKYGPYVGCKGEFRSLEKDSDIFSVSLDEALALLAVPKESKKRR